MKTRLDLAPPATEDGFVETDHATRSGAAPATGRGAHRVIGRHQVALLLLSYLGLVGTGTTVGLLLKGPLDDTAVVRTDRRVSQWFVGHRTPNLNRYTVWGSDLAD